MTIDHLPYSKPIFYPQYLLPKIIETHISLHILPLSKWLWLIPVTVPPKT